MGNCAHKLHGARAETPECFEGDGCKVMAGAVMMALVCGGFCVVATSRVTRLGRSAMHVGVGGWVDEGGDRDAQNVSRAGANRRAEIPACLRVVEGASVAAPLGALAAVGSSVSLQPHLHCRRTGFTQVSGFARPQRGP